MKSIAYWKITLVTAKFICGMSWTAGGVLDAASDSLPYHFIRFEENEGYRAGEFTGSEGGLKLLQGDARIIREDGGDAGQCLEAASGNPYASIHFRGERVSLNQKTYYEVWVRPSVTPLAKSEEFMDLDGAVLGFFSEGPDVPATFHAYHSLPENQGYWVSTGVSAAVGPSGMAEEWIRIGVCQNLATGNWDLEIGGEMVLKEIHSGESLQKDGIQLWLLGHEERANRFDDLLVSPVEPDSLRLGETKHLPKGRSDMNGQAEQLDRAGERKVGRKQDNEDRRRNDAEINENAAKIKPKSLDFQMDIVGGGTQHGKFDGIGSDPSQTFLLYSPQYDDDGNPLPLKVRIQCDSELAEGVDLSKILWVVTEKPPKGNDESLKVIAHGTFKTGFTQIAEIPSEWANKGTQIQVGANFVLTEFP